MNPLPLVPALVLFLHDLFTVVWIGGILFTALVLTPALRSARSAGTAGAATGAGAPSPAGDGPLAMLAKRVQTLQLPLVITSIVGLIVTGVLLARVRGSAGLFRFDTPYAVVLSVKHVLVVALVVMSLARRRAATASTAGGRASSALLVASAATGVVIIALSALNAAMR